MLVFYLFATLQLFFGYKSLRGGFSFLCYFKKELAKPTPNYQPFATIIAPCCGIDEDLEQNLSALFSQEYAEYEVLFVVDNADDESVATINKLIAEHGRAKLVIAGSATDCGQKVHNLRKAVYEVSDETEVLVFVDSDARPGKQWLIHLVAPLENEGIGCTTGYRWFVQKRGGFSTHLRAVWNASIASSLGENMAGNFCWGGSTAIKREVFERLEMSEKWSGVVSDDFALTNALHEADLPVYFVPQCLTATVEDTNFSELLEFTTRQMKITRVYSPTLWKISFVGAVLFSATFWGGILLLFLVSGVHFWLTLSFLVAIFSLGVGKAWVRLEAVRMVLKDYDKLLDGQTAPQLLLWTVSPILFLYNNIRALISCRIVWRRIEYELKSSAETAIISRNAK